MTLNKDRICSVAGCGKSVRCRGLCNAHRLQKAEKAKRVNPCGCGCGGLTSSRFIWGHHTRLFSSEEQARRGMQNDGNSQRDRGTKDTYRKLRGRHEHRRVMEEKLGRRLRPNEIVHHKNEIKRDNHPDNLEVMTRAQHIAEHREKMMQAQRRALAQSAH